MKRLYVLYDGSCGVCCRAVSRLAWEPAYLEMRFAPAGSMLAQQRFGAVLQGDLRQVVVVADTGEVYRGASAWIMVLYAMRRWRPLAMRLAAPGWRPWVERAIGFIGRHRYSVSSVLGWTPEAKVLQHVRLGDGSARPAAECTDGSCALTGRRLSPHEGADAAARLLEAKARLHRDSETLGVLKNPPE